jgi:hypothetical protein
MGAYGLRAGASSSSAQRPVSAADPVLALTAFPNSAPEIQMAETIGIIRRHPESTPVNLDTDAKM